MLPLIDPPLFESIATGLVWLAVIGVAGMAAVVALVATSDHPRPRPRATVTPLARRLPEAA
jgi:hypothetical protein